MQTSTADIIVAVECSTIDLTELDELSVSKEERMEENAHTMSRSSTDELNEYSEGAGLADRASDELSSV